MEMSFYFLFNREEARERILALLQQKKSEPPQVRLERVWYLLRMTDAAKLDMAIKYSTSAYLNNLLPVSFQVNCLTSDIP